MDFSERMERIRTFISNEVMFSSEAAKYLGISSQRLNQLVHSGKLIPVKISRAGTLFLKTDLDARKMELLSTGSGLSKGGSQKVPKNNVKVVQEAINYFTIQSLFGYSDKKVKPYYEQLNKLFDLSEPINKIYKEIASVINVDINLLEKAYINTLKGFEKLNEDDYIIKKGQDLYPSLLARTEEAPLFLFMRGNPQLVTYPTIAVVGTRNPSEDGVKKAYTLGALLGKYRIVVASGLAKGIDTAAHKGALQNDNPTIAVIGTPLTKTYPKENASLQHQIAEEGLVISQFPPSSQVQRWHFPMRNAIMSGISLATVVVEAGETSGALIQANYALKQGRFVFIPQGALDNPGLEWPKKYIKREGAASFSKIDELINKLENSKIINKEVLSEEQLKLFNDEEVGVNHVHRSK